MSEEEIKRIASVEMLNTIKTKLNSSMIFVYIENLEKENQKLKEDKKKIIKYIKNIDNEEFINTEHYTEILDILGDKENEWRNRRDRKWNNEIYL